MTTGPAQSPAKARAYRAIGWSVGIVGVAVSLSTGLVLLAVVPVYVAYLMLRRAKQHTTSTGEPALANDRRAPVLYLRSFQDEVSASGALHRFGRIAVPDERWLAASTPCNAVQEQDALGYLFRAHGPYVALGRPGEPLPELGSHKIYVVHDDWQDKVRQLLATSRAVLFSAGGTEGLRWELSELVRSVDPRKVALLLPTADDDYARFISWANPVLPIPLPARYPGRVLVFDGGWNSSPLPPGRTLGETFAPFLGRNGIAAKQGAFDKFMEHNGLRW